MKVSMDGQALQNFLREMKFNGSGRSNKYTRNRTVIQKYLHIDFFPDKEPPKTNEDDFDCDFDEFESFPASRPNQFFFQKIQMNCVIVSV